MFVADLNQVLYDFMLPFKILPFDRTNCRSSQPPLENLLLLSEVGRSRAGEFPTAFLLGLKGYTLQLKSIILVIVLHQHLQEENNLSQSVHAMHVFHSHHPKT